jgi:hypothetical protein
MTLLGDAMVVAALKAAAGGNITEVCAMVLTAVSNNYPHSKVAAPAPIMIRPMGSAFRIEAVGLGSFDIDSLSWRAFYDALATVSNRQIRNIETARHLWRETVARAQRAHGTFGRQSPTGKVKAGGAINATGFHSSRADGAE